MKALIVLTALGAVSVVSAQSYPGYGSGGNYQGQSSNYYQGSQYNQGSYQQPSSQSSQYNQGSYQQQPYSQSTQYNQGSYQQRGSDYASQTRSGSAATTSDDAIAQKIDDTLSSGWFSKGFDNVSFDVNNGNVQLSGFVDSIADKNKVEESIRKIEGVRRINNQIVVNATDASSDNSNSSAFTEAQLQNFARKFPQDSAATSQDRQLNARIREKLNGGWFSQANETIVIRTSNGVVVISGFVDKPEDIQKFNDQIKNIEGIRSIRNQLTLKNR